MYLNGHGVSQDSTEADKWFRLSAAQGNAKAQAHLGALYGSGQGVPQDYATARQWYEQAAVQGYASAQNNLGVLYRDGHGLPQEDVRAYMWFNLAVPRLTGDEQKLAVNNRDEFARCMTSAQIAEAQRLAQQCQAQNFKDC